MLGYIAKRSLMAVPVLLLVAIIVFVLIRSVPGDPATVLLGDVDDPHALDAMRRALGLDQPLVIQFGIWISNLLHGDFGRSIQNGEPVASLILARFRVTAEIVAAAMLVASLIGVPAGLFAAWRKGKFPDLFVTASSAILMAMPSFWTGVLFLLLFGAVLRWLPIVGYVSLTEDFRRGLTYLLLPVATLALAQIAIVARSMRASSLDVLTLDYVTHARAKGLPERVVLLRHVFPNAFAPTLTMIGLILGQLLGGAAVIETVFTLPGVGRLLVDSIYARDYPVVQGCLLLTASIYVLVNLVIDLLIPLLDPRVRP